MHTVARTLVSQVDWWPLCLAWLYWTLGALNKQRILQETTGNMKNEDLGDLLLFFFLTETCNKGAVFVSLLDFVSDTRRIIEMKAGQQRLRSRCHRTSSPGPGPNGERFGRFQWRSEHSAQPFGDNTLALLSLHFADFLPDTVFHLTPLSPVTCLSTHLQPSCYLSLHRHDTGHVTLLLCQHVWLKCSGRRNKICDKNFMVSGSGFALWCQVEGNEISICFYFSGCHIFNRGVFWIETRRSFLLRSPNTEKKGGHRDWWCGGEGLVSAEATGADVLSFNLVQIGPKEAAGEAL